MGTRQGGREREEGREGGREGREGRKTGRGQVSGAEGGCPAGEVLIGGRLSPQQHVHLPTVNKVGWRGGGGRGKGRTY